MHAKPMAAASRAPKRFLRYPGVNGSNHLLGAICSLATGSPVSSNPGYNNSGGWIASTSDGTAALLEVFPDMVQV